MYQMDGCWLTPSSNKRLYPSDLNSICFWLSLVIRGLVHWHKCVSSHRVVNKCKPMKDALTWLNFLSCAECAVLRLQSFSNYFCYVLLKQG